MLGIKSKSVLKRSLCFCLAISFSGRTAFGTTKTPSPHFKQSGILKMAGGTAHISFMQEIAEKLNQLNPGFKLLVAGGGSGVGVQKLGAGLIDLANSGRPLSAEEKTRFGLSSYPLAYDAITFIVNPENPVRDLSSTDLQNIFSGKIQSWEPWTKIPKQPIHLYVRDEASGTQDIFIEKILGDKTRAQRKSDGTHKHRQYTEILCKWPPFPAEKLPDVSAEKT